MVALQSTKEKGELAEAMALFRLQKAGYTVSQPFGENSRYDMVIDDGDDLLRVQVKHGRIEDGKVIATLRTVGYNSEGHQSSYYESGEVDVFVVCSLERDEIYMINYEETAKTQVAFRFEEPERENGDIKYSEDYLVEPK